MYAGLFKRVLHFLTLPRWSSSNSERSSIDADNSKVAVTWLPRSSGVLRIFSFRTVSFCLRALCFLHRFKILLHKLTRFFPPCICLCKSTQPYKKQQLANTEMLLLCVQVQGQSEEKTSSLWNFLECSPFTLREALPMLDLIFKNLRKTPCVFLQVVESTQRRRQVRSFISLSCA